MLRDVFYPPLKCSLGKIANHSAHAFTRLLLRRPLPGHFFNELQPTLLYIHCTRRGNGGVWVLQRHKPCTLVRPIDGSAVFLRNSDERMHFVYPLMDPHNSNATKYICLVHEKAVSCLVCALFRWTREFLLSKKPPPSF